MAKYDDKMKNSPLDNDIESPDNAFMDEFGLPSGRKPKGPTKTFVSSFLKSTANSTRRGVSRHIEMAMPSAVQTYSELVRVGDDFREMRDQFSSAVAKPIEELRVAGARILPRMGRYLPGPLQRKLEKIAKKIDVPEKPRTPSQEEERRESINRELGDVFKLQLEQNRTSQEEDRINQQLNRSIEAVRHAKLANITGKMADNIETIAKFHRITHLAYMKKDLELKYHHLFVARDTLSLTKSMVSIIESGLKNITHNTSLPDIAKTTIMDRQKNKLIESIQDKIYNYRQKFMKNIKDNIFGNIEQALSMAGTMGQMVSTMVDTEDMMSGDGDTDMFGNPLSEEEKARNKKNKTAQTIGNVGGGLTGGILGSRVGRKLVRNFAPFLEDVDSRFFGSQTKAVLHLEELRRKWQLGGGVKSLFASMLPGITSSDMMPDTFFSKGSEVTSFDNASRLSLVEVIPGWLGLIHKELASIRTGTEAPELTYNKISRSFTTVDTWRGDVIKRMVGSEKTRSQHLDTAISVMRGQMLGKGADVTSFDKVSGAIRRILANLSKRSRVFYPRQFQAFLEGRTSGYESDYITTATEGIDPDLALSAITHIVDSLISEDGQIDSYALRKITKAYTTEVTEDKFRKILPELVDTLGDRRHFSDIIDNTGRINVGRIAATYTNIDEAEASKRVTSESESYVQWRTRRDESLREVDEKFGPTAWKNWYRSEGKDAILSAANKGSEFAKSAMEKGKSVWSKVQIKLMFDRVYSAIYKTATSKEIKVTLDSLKAKLESKLTNDDLIQMGLVIENLAKQHGIDLSDIFSKVSASTDGFRSWTKSKIMKLFTRVYNYIKSKTGDTKVLQYLENVKKKLTSMIPRNQLVEIGMNLEQLAIKHGVDISDITLDATNAVKRFKEKFANVPRGKLNADMSILSGMGDPSQQKPLTAESVSPFPFISSPTDATFSFSSTPIIPPISTPSAAIPTAPTFKYVMGSVGRRRPLSSSPTVPTPTTATKVEDKEELSVTQKAVEFAKDLLQSTRPTVYTTISRKKKQPTSSISTDMDTTKSSTTLSIDSEVLKLFKEYREETSTFRSNILTAIAGLGESLDNLSIGVGAPPDESANTEKRGFWKRTLSKTWRGSKWLMGKASRGLKFGIGSVLPSALTGLGSAVGGIGHGFGSAFKGAANLMGSAWKATGSIVSSIFSSNKAPKYVNVYLKNQVDPGKPILSRREQAAGVYFADGGKVDRSEDIIEPVFDSEGQCLVTQEDIDHGLVDVDNNSLGSFKQPSGGGSLFKGFLGGIGKLGAKALGIGMEGLGGTLGLYTNILGAGVKGVGSLGSAIFDKLTGKTASKQSVEWLEKIYYLLDDRTTDLDKLIERTLPPERSKSEGAGEEDPESGLRIGSYEHRQWLKKKRSAGSGGFTQLVLPGMSDTGSDSGEKEGFFSGAKQAVKSKIMGSIANNQMFQAAVAKFGLKKAAMMFTGAGRAKLGASLASKGIGLAGKGIGLAGKGLGALGAGGLLAAGGLATIGYGAYKGFSRDEDAYNDVVAERSDQGFVQRTFGNSINPLSILSRLGDNLATSTRLVKDIADQKSDTKDQKVQIADMQGTLLEKQMKKLRDLGVPEDEIGRFLQEKDLTKQENMYRNIRSNYQKFGTPKSSPGKSFEERRKLWIAERKEEARREFELDKNAFGAKVSYATANIPTSVGSIPKPNESEVIVNGLSNTLVENGKATQEQFEEMKSSFSQMVEVLTSIAENTGQLELVNDGIKTLAEKEIAAPTVVVQQLPAVAAARQHNGPALNMRTN